MGKEPLSGRPRAGGVAPIAQLHDTFRSGEITPLTLIDQLLERIEADNSRLNAVLGLDAETAREAARAATERFAQGHALSTLDGVPIGVKDNIAMAGQPWTGGLGSRRNRIADEDSDVVRRLRAAGAIPFARLNMDEAAFGSTTANPHFGACRNPHDPSFTPGGSSGGPAAAVAAGYCVAALGTDTLGSVREPAHTCGVVGFKPSHGAASLKGVVPLAPALDCVGLLTRHVEDIAALRAALMDPDHTAPTETGLKLGVLDADSLGIDLNAEVREAWSRAVDAWSANGVQIVPTQLNGLNLKKLARLGVALCLVNLAREFSADADTHGGVSANLKAAIEAGRRITAPQIDDAYRSLLTARAKAASLFNDVDAVFLPTVPIGPVHSNDADEITLETTLLVGWVNVIGAPAVSLPIGHHGDGMPIGGQIVGPPQGDARVLALARQLETRVQLAC